MLSVLPSGTLALGLYDAAGKTRVALILPRDGNPGLDLYDAAGKRRAALMLLLDGSPGAVLELYDAAGKVIWRAP